MLCDAMIAVFAPFWPAARADERTRPAPPAPRRFGPVFIGDAVQPFAGETLLLALLRAEACAEDDKPG